MTTLDALLKQQAAIQKQIESFKSEGRNAAIQEIRSLMTQHGLTTADLAAAAKKSTTRAGNKAPVAAKYRDGEGNQWSGRGLKPKWLTQALKSGKKIEDFSV